MPPALNSLSVVIPAFNEEKTLERVVRWTLEVLEDLSPDHEVIIVDDASDDATSGIADALSAENARVRVIHHAANRGYGGALKSGFTAASKDLVTFLTADGEFYPTELVNFVNAVQDADVVSSYVPNRPMPLYRQILSKGWRLTMRVVLGECPLLYGILLYRRSVMDGMTIVSSTGMTTMEFLIRARRRGARIVTIPVGLHPRPDLRESKVTNLPTIWKHFVEIVRLRRLLRAEG
ncbi:MAG: glycosyltransferase family 2 protein [Gemmatimonadetes bacterium]|nr:glycosyltransferase family 2 protein [Gemmatimonadota bacterium]